MKYILVFVLFSFISTFSQENKSLISISFEEKKLEDAIYDLESISDYNFYFSKKWLENIVVNGSYNNKTLAYVLDDLLKDTVLNFYIAENINSIIILQNTIVYDELPSGFFGKRIDTVYKEKLVTDSNSKQPPIFLKNESKSRKRIDTYKIGKIEDGLSKETFTLQGVVTNIKTGEPIPDLSLLLKDTNRGAVTDDSGFYSIELPSGTNVLETRSLGIENIFLRVILYNDGKLDLELDEDIEQLDEVILSVSANKNVEETETGTTEIDVEESKTVPLVLGERDVLKVATSLPGISTAGEGSLGFNVRGGKTDQNLILFDNAVLYSPQHFFGIFSALNPFSLGEVIIYKGSIPAEYGGRLSSVFDLKTKKSNVEKVSGEGSIGPVTGNISLEVPIVKGKSSLLVAGRGAYANWILRSLNEESLNNSEASFYDFTATYEHELNKNNQVKGTAYTSRDDFSITSDSLFIYQNRLFSLNWTHKINDKNSLNLNLSNSQYGFNIEFDGDSNDNFDFGFNIDETSLKLKLRSIINEKTSIDYGVSSKLYNIEPGNIDPLGAESSVQPFEVPEERGLESALFLSTKIDFTKKLSVNAGVRFSLFNALGPSNQLVFEDGQPRREDAVVDTLNFNNNEVVETFGGPEFRISARYLLAKDLSIKAGFNNTYQYIHRLSNNTTVSPIDTWTLSNSNIRPQTANQYSLGIFKNFKENQFETSIEGFFKTSNNILDFRTGAQILLNENIETEVLQGEGRAYGVEFLIRKNYGKLNGWLGYTYSRSFLRLDSEFDEERVNNGEFFQSNFDKPHDFSLVTNYKFNRKLSLSTNFVYQTGRPITFPVGNFNFNNSDFVAFSNRNQFRIPDFYRLDLGFNIEGNHKKKKLAHSFWTISVYNVLGRNNPFSVFFVTEQGEIRALQSSIFSIPIPAITYNLKF